MNIGPSIPGLREASITDYRIPLSVPTFGSKEIEEAIDSLTSKRVTMGTKVATFEGMFARAIGSEHALMLNSGSSAALVAFALLRYGEPEELAAGDEVIFPLVDWSTPVFAAAALGLTPVLVDVELPSLNISLESAREALSKRSRVIVPTHMMGYPVDMPAVKAFAEEHSLWVFEDACEALGATLDGRYAGTFGDMGFFSFYFSHHISTIEGGMLVTDDDWSADVARAVREHGLSRRMEAHEEYVKGNPRIDPRFLFAYLGFNLRPTEIQGAFGIHQLPRLDSFVRIRRENARRVTQSLRPFHDLFILPAEEKGYRHVYQGYPVLLTDDCPFGKHELVRSLEEKGIETRPIVAGNLLEHPAMKHVPHRVGSEAPNATKAMRDGFYFGMHQGMDREDCDYIASTFEEFIKGATQR